MTESLASGKCHYKSKKRVIHTVHNNPDLHRNGRSNEQNVNIAVLFTCKFYT